MDIRQLQAFIGAVDTGSLTKTAAALNITQPTVTNRIKTLEKSLGSVLLERLPDGVRPTVVGQSLIAHAREIVRLSSEVHRMVDEPGELSGRISIGASESLINHRLLPLIEYIFLRYPKIELSLRLSTPQESATHLRNGEVDCVFTIGEGTPSDDVNHLDLCPEPIVLVVAPHRRTTPGRRHEEKFEELSTFLACADVDVRHFGDLPQGGRSADRSRRILRINSLEAVRKMAENGIGAALVPEIAVSQDIAEGRLSKVVWQPLTRTFTQAWWRRSNVPRPALEAVLKAAAKVVQER